MARDHRPNNNDKPGHRSTEAPRPDSRFRLPDPPERDAAHAAAVFDALYKQSASQDLLPLLGKADTTLITAGRHVIPNAGADTSRIPYPHMMIALNVDVALFEASDAYIIAEQGKPPDWVIMLASDSTAEANLRHRRDYFESLGVPEYWLLDHRAYLHGAILIGNRLVNGRYEPVEIETLPNGNLQGYSPALDIFLRWTGEYLDYISPDSTRAETEREARLREQARADAEQQARQAAEARLRELEERYGERPPAEQG